MNHYFVAEQAINEIKKTEGISKILLFGSVARGTESADSDIDIAIILNDILRMLPSFNCLDTDGIPVGYEAELNKLIQKIKERYKIILDANYYWESYFKKGIELYGRKKQPPDLLHEVGIVKFDASKQLF